MIPFLRTIFLALFCGFSESSGLSGILLRIKWWKLCAGSYMFGRKFCT